MDGSVIALRLVWPILSQGSLDADQLSRPHSLRSSFQAETGRGQRKLAWREAIHAIDHAGRNAQPPVIGILDGRNISIHACDPSAQRSHAATIRTTTGRCNHVHDITSRTAQRSGFGCGRWCRRLVRGICRGPVLLKRSSPSNGAGTTPTRSRRSPRSSRTSKSAGNCTPAARWRSCPRSRPAGRSRASIFSPDGIRRGKPSPGRAGRSRSRRRRFRISPIFRKSC